MADIWIFTNLNSWEFTVACFVICFVAVFVWILLSTIVAGVISAVLTYISRKTIREIQNGKK